MQELITALIAAQAEMNDPLKNASNPGFKGSKFADLGAHLEAVREPLRKHGLTLTQTLDFDGASHALITTIHHVSGQQMSSRMGLVLSKNDMQGLGSAITYARRYSIGAMFALYGDTDDDANEASNGPAKPAPSPTEALYNNAKARLQTAKTPADKAKILSLIGSLPAEQQAELKALAGAK